jgi:protein-S-isoprenylcysteine O-methyltransferase Ste14
MRWTSWVWRGALALLALLVLAEAIANFVVVLGPRKVPITPFLVSAEVFDLWFFSWLCAALWSRPAASQPRFLQQAAHWTPTLIGFVLLGNGSAIAYPGPLHWINEAKLPLLPLAASWIATAICIAGLGLTWWARISLGSLWSGSVSRKKDHTIVRKGPYALVRHPIYTGLIIAAFAIALQIAMAVNLFGAILVAVGFWLKARLEERFLSQELGPVAYADYRRSTPMLIPFWPA